MGSIIAVINNKGGVGKSTITTNLAAALGTSQGGVLVVDLDPQCDSTDNLGEPNIPQKQSLWQLLSDGMAGEDVDISKFVTVTDSRGVMLLPNHVETAWIEAELYSDIPKNFLLLRKLLREYASKNYQFTILDTPPNMGVYVTMAMAAADLVLVPVDAGSKRAIKGLSRAITTIGEVQETINPGLKFLRLIINRIDKRTAISKAVIQQLNDRFGKDLICSAMIPSNTAIQQAEAAGKTVLSYAPNSKGSQQFRALAKEIAEISGRD